MGPERDVAVRMINESTGATVASQVELALDRATRRRGLLGRDSLAPRSAMLFSPCWMVHTAFMRFAIDVLFVDRHGRVVHVAHAVRPWRAAMSARAHVVVELPAGAAAQQQVHVGDCVGLVADGADDPMPAFGQLPLQVRAC
jgi:uncharacterized membrane protein (UPF0127 family)